MKKSLLAVALILLLSVVSYASFIHGERFLLHTSVEESKAVLRNYRAMKNSKEVVNYLRYRSIVVLDEPSDGPESEKTSSNKVVAAVRAVQSKDVYVVLHDNGSIEEYKGSLDDL